MKRTATKPHQPVTLILVQRSATRRGFVAETIMRQLIAGTLVKQYVKATGKTKLAASRTLMKKVSQIVRKAAA